MRQARDWSDQLGQGRQVWVSINIAGRQLEEPRFAEDVLAVLKKHSMPPQSLLLELKLGCLQRRSEGCSLLQDLRNQGVRVFIDKFGSEPVALL